MTQARTGWAPDATAKRALKGYSFDVCAYLYPDGVMISEKRHAKDGKHSVEYTVYHVWHCEIPLRLGNQRSGVDQRTITRIVCHNARVLLDGVAQVEVYRDNQSDAMKARGLSCETLTLTTLSGAEHRSDDWNGIKSSDYTVQTGTDTLEEVIAYHKEHSYTGDKVELHI